MLSLEPLHARPSSTIIPTLKRIISRGLARFALVTFSALPLSLPATADIALVFGTYAADKPTETVKTFKPFLAFLADEMSENLGERVNISMQIARTYEDAIDQLVTGKVDFARFGPASYVTAKSRNDKISILAMESKNGKKTFKGVIAVHTDSEIHALADLDNHSFAFGNELSTIGRYLAQKALLDAGLNAGDLKSYAYLGRHDRVGAAVGNGEFDAGALKSSTFQKMVKKNIPIRELVSFDNVTKPWLASEQMDKTLVAAMREVLLNLNNSAVLKKISKSGFLEGTDEDYVPIRNAINISKGFDG